MATPSQSTAFVDDDEYEYEYSTESSSYFITLDLTSHVENKKRRHPAADPAKETRKRPRMSERRVASPDMQDLDALVNESAAQAAAENPSDYDDDDPYDDNDPFHVGPSPRRVLPRKPRIKQWLPTRDETRAEVQDADDYDDSEASTSSSSSFDDEEPQLDPDLQLTELHTGKPLLAIDGTVYDLEWATPVGTDMHFVAPTRRGVGERARLLGVSSTRLVAKPLKLEFRAAAEEAERALDEEEQARVQAQAEAAVDPDPEVRLNTKDRTSRFLLVDEDGNPLADGTSQQTGPLEEQPIATPDDPPSTPPNPAPDQPTTNPAAQLHAHRSSSTFMQNLLALKRAQHEHDAPRIPTSPRSPIQDSAAASNVRYYMGPASKGERAVRFRMDDNRRRNTLFGEYGSPERAKSEFGFEVREGVDERAGDGQDGASEDVEGDGAGQDDAPGDGVRRIRFAGDEDEVDEGDEGDEDEEEEEDQDQDERGERIVADDEDEDSNDDESEDLDDDEDEEDDQDQDEEVDDDARRDRSVSEGAASSTGGTPDIDDLSNGITMSGGL